MPMGAPIGGGAVRGGGTTPAGPGRGGPPILGGPPICGGPPNGGPPARCGPPICGGPGIGTLPGGPPGAPPTPMRAICALSGATPLGACCMGGQIADLQALGTVVGTLAVRLQFAEAHSSAEGLLSFAVFLPCSAAPRWASWVLEPNAEEHRLRSLFVSERLIGCGRGGEGLLVRSGRLQRCARMCGAR